MNNYTFLNNEFLYLLVIPIAILVWYAFRNASISSVLVFSDTKLLSNQKTIKQKLRHLPYLLKIFALACPKGKEELLPKKSIRFIPSISKIY